MHKETGRDGDQFGASLAGTLAPIEAINSPTEPSIVLSDGRLVIERFSTERPPVLAAFEAENEEDHVPLLERLLEVGAAAQLHAGARVDLEHLADEVARVEEAFSRGAGEITERLVGEVESGLATVGRRVEELFGAGGVLPGLLDPSAPDGVLVKVAEAAATASRSERERLVALLDPRSAQSPLALIDQQLKALSAGLTQVRVDLAAERAAASAASEERAKGTAKGRSYQHSLLPALREAAKPFGDIVEYVGDTKEIDGRQTGDFVITISARERAHGELRIAFEAKDARCGLTAMKRELTEARKRRGAVVGVGVYAHEELMPTGTAPIAELSPVDFTVLYDPDVDDVEALRLAYRLARITALSAARTMSAGKVDAEGLRVDLAEARDRVKALLAVRAELTRISNGVAAGVDAVRGKLATQAHELSSLLDRMEGRLLVPSTSDEQPGHQVTIDAKVAA